MSEQATAADDGVEATEESSGSEEETTSEVEFPSFEVELPADLAAELEEDDSDLEVTDDDIDALAIEHEDVPRDVLQRMVAAEKKAAHLEKLRVNDQKKNWKEEAKKFFPLAEPVLDDINATSRRGYLRTAKNFHEKLLPTWNEAVGKAKAAQEAAKEEAKAEGKQEAKKAWGQPVDQPPPSEAVVTLQASQERRRPRELSETIKTMLFPKE